MRIALAALLPALAAACGSLPEDRATAVAAAETSGPGDIPGWVDVNCAPGTWTLQDGVIVCTGVPTGVLRSERMHENFVLDVEYRHLKPGGNAGIFVWSDPITARGQPFTRSIEVQVMDGVETPDYTSDGDLFSIHGARCVPDRPHPKGWERCLPSQKRAKPSPEWNHCVVTCKDGRIELALNGKVVSGVSECTPRKGYLCLESEGSEVHFRNLRITELPPSLTPPPPSHVAREAEPFRTLYTGVDLSGWRENPEKAGHWTAKDWVLSYDGKGDHLWTEEEFGDFVLIADWRFTSKPTKTRYPEVLPDGSVAKDPDGKDRTIEVDDAGDSGIYLRGNDKSQVNIWCWPVGSGEVYGYRTDATTAPEVRAGVTPRKRADAPLGQWNRFEITMKGDRLTVVLNGETVLERAQLPGVPARGRIALQNHGAAVDFANLLIRDL